MDEYLTSLGMIYRINDIEKKPIWFTELVKRLDGILSKSEISKSLDKLEDLGLIETGYNKVGNRWTNTICVSDEAKTFAKEMEIKLKQKE